MAETTLIDTETQEFIEGLITLIWQAEDPESVTNEMVARVLDYLNKRRTPLVQGKGDSEEVAMSQKAVTDELDAIADDIRDIRAQSVLAIELDEASGELSLLYSEDNTSLADAYINHRGEIVIEQMIDDNE